MSTFTIKSVESLPKQDKVKIQNNFSEDHVIQITNASIDNIYITAYRTIQNPKVIIIYRSTRKNVLKDHTVLYQNKEEIVSDITDASTNQFIQLHLIECLFYTWSIDSDCYLEQDFELGCITIALHTGLLSIRVFNHLTSIEPLPSCLYNSQIAVDKTKDSMLDLLKMLSYKMYATMEVPWVSLTTSAEWDSISSLKETAFLKSSFTFDSLDEKPPAVPYIFGSIGTKESFNKVLTYSKETSCDFIVSSLFSFRQEYTIPENVTVLEYNTDATDSTRDYSITTSETFSESNQESIKFGKKCDLSSKSIDCVLNNSTKKISYSPEIFQILSTEASVSSSVFKQFKKQIYTL